MFWLVVSLIAFAATSVLCGIPRLSPRIKIVTSTSGVILGSLLGIVPAAQVLSQRSIYRLHAGMGSHRPATADGARSAERVFSIW